MTKEDKTTKDDNPTTDAKANPELNIAKGKVKKNKKKKKSTNKSQSSVSSSSASESGSVAPGSVPPLVIDEPTREQFYDAHESYHGLPENALQNPAAVVPPPTALAPVATPAIATSLLIAHSEHAQDPKTQTAPPSAATHQSLSAGRARKAPSTVNKPVSGPQ